MVDTVKRPSEFTQGTATSSSQLMIDGLNKYDTVVNVVQAGMGASDTGDLPEGSNLYYTDARAVDAGKYTYSEKSGDYPVVAGDHRTLFNVDTTSGNITLTLPDSVTVGDGYEIIVKHNGGGNNVIISRAGTDTVDGNTTYTITNENVSVRFINNGAGERQIASDFNPSDGDVTASGTLTANDIVIGNGTTQVQASGKQLSETAGINKVPQANASGVLDPSWYNSNTNTNSDYKAGEDISEGEIMFVEDMIAFADADQEQNIGDVAGNTRVSFPIIGSGTAGTTLKLSLKVISAPSVDLGLRIETDNAGDPSGTLADANATSSIAAGSLTGTLADTTMTLAGSVTLTEGTKYHVVLFQGTYGSETVNGTNYYAVGYDVINTTTRGLKLYNASWGSVDNDKYIYSTSDIYDAKLLSLTDANYSYKLPDFIRVATTNYTIGQTPIYVYAGISNHFSGLTRGSDYYISDTPGAISTTRGTIHRGIGRAVDTDRLYIINDVVCAEDNSYIAQTDTKTTNGNSYVEGTQLEIHQSGDYQIQYNCSAVIGSGSLTASAYVAVNGIQITSVITVFDNDGFTDTSATQYRTISLRKGDVVSVFIKGSTTGGTSTGRVWVRSKVK